MADILDFSCCRLLKFEVVKSCRMVDVLTSSLEFNFMFRHFIKMSLCLYLKTYECLLGLPKDYKISQKICLKFYPRTEKKRSLKWFAKKVGEINQVVFCCTWVSTSHIQIHTYTYTHNTKTYIYICECVFVPQLICKYILNRYLQNLCARIILSSFALYVY